MTTSHDSRAELERWKSDINLSEFAASEGYQIVKRERSASGKWRGSTAAWVIMRNPATDHKVVIGRGKDGHWLFCNNSDGSDNGSIIDFIA